MCQVGCKPHLTSCDSSIGFSKNKLKHIVETVGIKHFRIPDLGIESEDRAMLETKEDYFKLFETYKNSLEQKEAQFKQLYSLCSSMIQSSHKNIVSSLKHPDKGVFFIPKS